VVEIEDGHRTAGAAERLRHSGAHLAEADEGGGAGEGGWLVGHAQIQDRGALSGLFKFRGKRDLIFNRGGERPGDRPTWT
jgi:hypothetical protein